MESEMTAYDVDNEKWNEGLTDLVNTDSGVKLNFSVPHEYFQSISNKGTSFERMIMRLGEFVDVHYYHFFVKMETSFVSVINLRILMDSRKGCPLYTASIFDL